MKRVRLWAAVAFLLPTAAWPQSWRSLGPPGGDVRSLASDPKRPEVLYLGTADGVLYRSDDAGARWIRLSPGFPTRGMSLDEIRVLPGGRVAIGYWEVSGGGGGVALSRDRGEHVSLLPGMNGQSVRALATSESLPGLLVAGSLEGVFRSLDEGQSWERISPAGHPELRNVESLALDPVDPALVFAGTWHLPWRSRDGGRHWEPMRAGMIDDSDVFTLTLDSRSPRTLYATACTGIYRSRDGGERWGKLPGIPSSARRTRSFAQDVDHPQNLYAGTTQGLWMSDDDGASWHLLTPKNLVVNSVLVLPGSRIVLGCDGVGVLRSDDGGITWMASNEGFFERFVSAMTFDSAGGGLLAGIVGDRHGGVLRRGTEGWRTLGTGLEGREVLALAVVGGRVIAGTDDGLFGLDRSAGWWDRLPAESGGVDLHPRVLGLVAPDMATVLAATSQGLLLSRDRGASWSPRNVGFANSVTAVCASGNLALASTPLGIFRSQDTGATWERTPGGPTDSRVHSMVLGTAKDSAVFAATPSGLFRSSDRGTTWVRLGGTLPVSDIVGLALGSDSRTLYASDFTFGGLFQSLDAGETWSRIGTTGLPSDRVWGIALGPTGEVVVATPTGGLSLLSPSGGAAGTGNR